MRARPAQAAGDGLPPPISNRSKTSAFASGRLQDDRQSTDPRRLGLASADSHRGPLPRRGRHLRNAHRRQDDAGRKRNRPRGRPTTHEPHHRASPATSIALTATDLLDEQPPHEQQGMDWVRPRARGDNFTPNRQPLTATAQTTGSHVSKLRSARTNESHLSKLRVTGPYVNRAAASI